MTNVDVEKELYEEIVEILEVSSLKIYYPTIRSYVNQAIKEKTIKIKLEHMDKFIKKPKQQ